MSIKDLELAIEQGDFDSFCRNLSSLSASVYPEITLKPKLALKVQSEENVDVYIGLLKQGLSPRNALDLSKKYSSLEEARSEIRK
jgi:hypothetical protein